MAINKTHAKNKDKFLDKGGPNELTAAETRSFIDSKGQASGLAELDGSGLIPSAQIPAIAITQVDVVADIPARDALTPQVGDVAKVTDSDGSGNPQTYIWDGTTWIDIQETSNVISVNGSTGVVVLDTDDISEATNLYYTEVRVAANSAVAANTSKISYTDAAAVALNTAKVGYTEALVSANTDVAANTAARNNATTIQGRVIDAPVAGDDGKAVTYDLTLDKQMNAIVTIDTVPKQTYVAKDGT